MQEPKKYLTFSRPDPRQHVRSLSLSGPAPPLQHPPPLPPLPPGTTVHSHQPPPPPPSTTAHHSVPTTPVLQKPVTAHVPLMDPLRLCQSTTTEPSKSHPPSSVNQSGSTVSRYTPSTPTVIILLSTNELNGI